jgi:Lipid A core - O-antigen ligase and related enzymes
MDFLRKNEARITRLFVLLNIINFVCMAPKLSNMVILVAMNIVGLAFFFFLYQRRLNKYALFFILSALYVYWAELFYFGATASFDPLHRIVAAFFAGMVAITVYQRNSWPIVSMFYPLPFVLLAGTAGFWLYCWLTGDFSDAYYQNTTRLQLFNLHPFRYGMLLAVSCIICMSVMVKNITAQPYVSRLRGITFLFSTPVACLCFSLCFGLLILAQSRVAMIACVIALAVCLLPGIKKLFTLKALAMFAGVVIVSGALYGLTSDAQERNQIKERFISVIAAPHEVGSFVSRQALWECAVHIVRENPLLGTGRTSFYREKEAFIRANYAQFTKKYGKDVVDNDTLRLENPHNQYVSTAVEHGLVGLGFFVILLAYPIYHCVRHRTVREFILPLLVYFAVALLGDGYLFGNKISIQGISLYYMTLGAFAGLTSSAAKTPRPKE